MYEDRQTFRCLGCGKLLKDLTQTKTNELCYAVIEGYCESCGVYSKFCCKVDYKENGIEDKPLEADKP